MTEPDNIICPDCLSIPHPGQQAPRMLNAIVTSGLTSLDHYYSDGWTPQLMPTTAASSSSDSQLVGQSYMKYTRTRTCVYTRMHAYMNRPPLPSQTHGDMYWLHRLDSDNSRTNTIMLCYVMLCYVMLCYVMLCYVMLCYVMLHHVTVHYITLRYVT